MPPAALTQSLDGAHDLDLLEERQPAVARCTASSVRMGQQGRPACTCQRSVCDRNDIAAAPEPLQPAKPCTLIGGEALAIRHGCGECGNKANR